jgi:hypothetical protein
MYCNISNSSAATSTQKSHCNIRKSSIAISKKKNPLQHGKNSKKSKKKNSPWSVTPLGVKHAFISQIMSITISYMFIISCNLNWH